MTPGQRARRAWEVSILLVLAVVIVAALAFNVANLRPLDPSTPLAPEPSPRGALTGGHSDPIVAAVLWALTLLWIVPLVFLLRRSAHLRRRLWWGLLVSALGLLLIMPFVTSIPPSGPPGENETAGRPEGPETPPATDAPPASGVQALTPRGTVAPLLLFVVVGFAVILWVLFQSRRIAAFPTRVPRDDPEVPGLRTEATAAVRGTIQDLEIGADVRLAILACFQRFCRLLRSRGVADQEALTAHEIETLAVQVLAVSADASASLTSLFDEARYSAHALGEVDRARAIADLGRIRAALGA